MPPVTARSRTIVVVAALAVLAVVARAVAFSATELYADEAYYWSWSLRPAAGYYDHPPLVAWLIRAGTAVAGGELGVRVASLLAGGLTVVFAALLARELSDDPRAPLWGALLCLSAPLLHVLGALALPDAPLVAAYSAALWLLARARGSRWAWVGVAAGVALLSKYTAGLLAPALVLLVAWDPELRAALRTRWPWIGAAVAVALFAPCLAWNAAHGWASISFQLGHAFAQRATGESLLLFLAGQVAGAGPVALAAGLAFLARPRTSAARRVAAGVLVPLAVTVWSAARGKVEANWPALVYPALASAAAAALLRAPARRGPRLAVGAAVAVSGALLAIFAVEQRHPRLLAGTPAVERFHGWRAMAAEVRAMAPAACAEVGCDAAQPFVFPASYQYASELAFYGGFRRLGAAAERRSQLDLWDERPAPGEPFLFVGEGVPSEVRRALAASGERGTATRTIRHRGVALRDVTVTAFAGYAGGLVRR